MLIITHYQRLLDYVVPDEVHIFDKGKIVKSGKSDLVKILGRGELKAGIKISAHKFTASAKSAIETAGGEAVVIE